MKRTLTDVTSTPVIYLRVGCNPNPTIAVVSVIVKSITMGKFDII
jgi:hypothetical protein